METNNISTLLNIKTPQLIGIIVGCAVFSITIAVVVYLLIASGALQGAIDEITGKKAAKNAELKSKNEFADVIPELYEHLLKAAATLPTCPAVPESKVNKTELTPFTEQQAPSVIEICNGSAIYGESAYDPWIITWRWFSDLSQHPWKSVECFTATFKPMSPTQNFAHLVIRDTIVRKPIGMISVVDNAVQNLSVRLEYIWVTPSYRRSHRAQEAVFLVLKWLFQVGYRRVTAEVDDRNTVGKKFLEQCGFLCECVMRKHKIVNNRNRDSALYVMLNSDWPDEEIKLKRKLGIPLKEELHKIATIES